MEERKVKMYKMSVAGRITKTIAFTVCICIFFAISMWGVLMQSNYSFDDYPYFEWNNFSNYIAISINIFLISGIYLLFRHRKINVFPCLVLYGLICFAFILIIPLEPFSDMKSIFDIARKGLSDESGYLSRYTNQIPVTLYLYLLSFLGKSIIIPKLMNILCNILIVYMTYKIHAIIFREDKRIIFYTCMFVPAILYANHIYNDTISTALTVVMAYLALSPKKGRISFFIMILFSALSVWLRASNILFVIAIIIYMLFSIKLWKHTVVYLMAFAIFLCGFSLAGKKLFDTDKEDAYPIWSFIQMGFNEEEFGFQDGSHSVEWTFSDCIDRVKDLGVPGTLKLLAKKELWMWSEGTYQAERYGFGDAAASYSYNGIVTRNIGKMDRSFLRKAVVYFMKGQYYLFAILALAGIYAGKNKKGAELLMYFICGFFCFYLIWEMKSRYIYALYPYMLIFACNGANYINDSLIDRKSRFK